MQPTGGLDRIATLVIIVFIILKLTGVLTLSWWWIAGICIINGLIAVILYSFSNGTKAHIIDAVTGIVTVKTISAPVDVLKVLGHDGELYAVTTPDTSSYTAISYEGWQKLCNSKVNTEKRQQLAETLVNEAASALSWHETSKQLGINDR